MAAGFLRRDGRQHEVQRARARLSLRGRGRRALPARATAGRRFRSPARCVAGVVGLLLWSPHIATHWSSFARGFVGQLGRYGATQHAARVRSSIRRTVFPATFGWPGFLLCFAGLVWCLRRRVAASSWSSTCSCSTPASWGRCTAIFVRYGSPVVPALAAAGGIAASLLVERLSERGRPRGSRWRWWRWSRSRCRPSRLVAFDRLARPAATRVTWRRTGWSRAAPASVVLTEGAYGQVHAVDRQRRRRLPSRSSRRRSGDRRRSSLAPTAPADGGARRVRVDGQPSLACRCGCRMRRPSRGKGRRAGSGLVSWGPSASSSGSTTSGWR